MKYQVFYARTPLYCLYGHRGHLERITVEKLSETHVFVREVEAESKGEVYCSMQGEVWSPRGEAKPLIKRLGLSHTSMSIGDVVQDQDGRYWLCVEMGWKELGSQQEESQDG